MNSVELVQIEVYLYYFHVQELREVCDRFQLSSSGNKKDLILRLLSYFKSGKKQELMSFPDSSRVIKGRTYPLEPKTKILMGAYKNDLNTRMFFKKHIGDHFHFTAFGIDWINERWAQGDPPTYEEFASFWQKEYESRKIRKATLKKEWAYLNFIQRYSKEHPECSKAQVIEAWKLERNSYVQKANMIFDSFFLELVGKNRLTQ
ncbi:MAG: DUF6434 domain-containing protein [Candidatus Dependentiae bacterium]|nr:DUF6434 domain-containing protein [Candidatus Dependentiae bacterium]